MARLKHAKTVYTLPEALYYPGAPVCITGGRLLAEGELLACLLTLQVIEDVRVKSVTAAFLPLDADGTPTGRPTATASSRGGTRASAEKSRSSCPSPRRRPSVPGCCG